MNTRTPPKKQAFANPVVKTNKADGQRPSRPDWSFWKRRRYCRIWQAALLSLDVEPSHANRARLEESEPLRYAEYRKRREILIVNRGHHSQLASIEHLRAGEKEGEQYIDLSQVLEFARLQDWSMVEEFIQGMEGKHPETSTLGSGIQDIDEEELDVYELKKGDRYLIVRMGAILIFLERCLRSGKEVNPHSFLKPNDLNYLALGKEVEEIIKGIAGKKDARFGFEGNRDIFSAAVKAVQTFFKTARR